MYIYYIIMVKCVRCEADYWAFYLIRKFFQALAAVSPITDWDIPSDCSLTFASIRTQKTQEVSMITF
jgi:hypothetical protein